MRDTAPWWGCRIEPESPAALVAVCGEGLGVDQANVAVFLAGTDGLFGSRSQPASIGLMEDTPLPLAFPCTRRSKSSSALSFPPLLEGKPGIPPSDRKSSLDDDTFEELESS